MVYLFLKTDYKTKMQRNKWLIYSHINTIAKTGMGTQVSQS